MFLLDEGRDRAVVADTVDRIKVIVMAVRNIFLCVDILAERGMKVSPLQIVRRKRIACEDRVHVASFDQG